MVQIYNQQKKQTSCEWKIPINLYETPKDTQSGCLMLQIPMGFPGFF